MSVSWSFHFLRAIYPFTKIRRIESFEKLGGSPGLVVMGRDSSSKGRGFDSRHCILDGHFSHLFVVKNVKFV